MTWLVRITVVHQGHRPLYVRQVFADGRVAWCGTRQQARRFKGKVAADEAMHAAVETLIGLGNEYSAPLAVRVK